MKILFLDPVGTLGGAERSLVDLVASLRAAEPSMPIGLVAGADGPLREEAANLGVDVHVLPLPPGLLRAGEHSIAGMRGILEAAPALLSAGGALASYARDLDRLVDSLGPVVVHSNGMKMHLLSAMLPRRGIRTVWHLRDFLGQRAIMAHALRAVEGKVDAIVGISHSVAEDAARTLRRKDVTVIYNGIDTARFTPEGRRADLDALAGLPPAPEGTVRVGLVATYARWKGHEILIEAAARCAARSPRVPLRFYLVGGATYDTRSSQLSHGDLKALIDGRGLGRTVGLVPFQREPHDVYRALDVAVHASTRPEPFGRTIAEAMSSARAVVLAREGGAAELAKDGVDCVAVAPRDPGVLADAVLALAGDPSRRASLGAAARASAVSRFSRERLGPEVLAVYRRIGAIR